MINSQALIGTMLGTYVLEELIAQGEMGAVFFARQMNSQERVAVKLFFSPPSIAAQASSSRADFLERFRQEMTVIASLTHQHILPLYTYGEHRGLPYLVMPYIAGGSLVDILQREGQLAMSRLLSYLEQIAAALDYAHERGIIHYHLKPANVLLTPSGSVLVADFGQVNLLGARPTSQMSLLRAGTPVGSLEYMAPEQLMGDVLDARVDLYALGIILYQIVTGKTPFQGATPLQMATMLVQAAPPAPRSLRADLPEAAEQVILHALAKHSRDRYARAQDIVHALRAALAVPATPTLNAAAAPAFKKRSRSLFDPLWQQSGERGQPPAPLPGSGLLASFQPEASPRQAGPRPTGLLSSMHAFVPSAETSLAASEQEKSQAPLAANPGRAPFSSQALSASAAAPDTSTTDSLAPTRGTAADPQSPFPPSNVTGALTTGALPGANVEQGSNGTVKLTGAMKVVQVPVAGQPGRFVTGLLPVLPATAQQEEISAPAAASRKMIFSRQQKIVAVLLLGAVVLASSGLFWFLHSRSAMPAKYGIQVEHVAPDLQAIAAARATATATANTILADPLTSNIHNLPLAAHGSKVFRFANDGYHILDNDANQSAPAILPDLDLKGPMVYALTMMEVKGNDGSINNSFGMILRLSTRNAGNKSVVTFYCFEVVNTNAGQYEFVKYDSSSKGSTPWSPIWQHPFGGEYHQGHGTTRSNTFKVAARGKSFTFFVNGKRVGSATDGSLTHGEIGMLVNLKGTEVAFSNLLVTYS